MTLKPMNSLEYVLIKTDASEIQICPRADDIDSALWSIERMAGILLSNHGAKIHALSDCLVTNISLATLLRNLGEWVAIGKSDAKEGSRYIALSDAYGYAPLFYSLVPGSGIFLSDSFQGIAAGLSDNNVTLDLDITHYATMVSARGSQLYNLSSTRTMSEQVQILDVTSVLIVEKSEAKIINRNNLTNSGFAESYETNIDLGIEKSSEILESISSNNNGKKRITLSGGVDSRIVFGLLKKAGVSSEYQVFSDDPRIWPIENSVGVIERDISIANQIREDYGLSWWDGDKKATLSIDFLESLKFFQSYRSNFSYTFKPMSTHELFIDDVITARGGGGELLRSTEGGATATSSFTEEMGERPNVDDQFFEWVSKRYLQGSVNTDYFSQGSVDLFTAELRDCTGETPEEVLNSLYFRTRNRAHFGHARLDSSANDIVLQLLSNPFFLKASSQIEFDMRKKGDLVSELFDKIEPGLRGYNFENKTWTDKLSFDNHLNIVSSDKRWIKSLDSAYITQPEPRFLKGWSPGIRGESFNFNAVKSSINYVKRAAFAIENWYSGSDLKELRDLHARVINGASNGYLNLSVTVAKMASAIDVLFPQKAGIRSLVYDTESSNGNKIDIHRIEIAYPFGVQDGWQNDPVFEHVSLLEVKGNGLLATMLPVSTSIRSMEYAFYLQRDGKTVDQKWYGQQTAVEFEIDQTIGGLYRSISFVRPKGELGPIYHVASKDIRL
ncbi:hypothetical protein [Glutamicibacter arilaitensis]|uniref:hypothetical protein n=1 Tax=Glutamicibacter arilaitensis TaxID=256701 RepID=UPI00384C1ECD